MFESNSTATLFPANTVEVVNDLLKSAQDTKDTAKKLLYCHCADSLLSDLKRGVNRSGPSKNDDERRLREGIARAYYEHADLMADLGNAKIAQNSRRKAEKWGGQALQKVATIPKRRTLIPEAVISESIFPLDVRPPSSSWSFPEPDGRVDDTPQLVSCLGLLQQGSDSLADDVLDPKARKWLRETEDNEVERTRLQDLASDLIRAFTREEIKDKKAVSEVLCLVPVLSVEDFRFLLRQFLINIEAASILDIEALRGLARLLQGASPGHLQPQDLIAVLGHVSSRLQDTHEQSSDQIFELTFAVSSILDAMADTKVTGLKRVELHEPLLSFLGGLQGNIDPHLKYYASYAFQALLCVPDDESPWQATVRRTTKIVKGISGLVSAVKGLDLNGFMSGLQNIQEGFEGIQQVYDLAVTAYEGVSAVYEGEQDLVASLKEGLTFNRKRAWYSALRGMDTLINSGEMAKFRILVCGAPCRLELAFQWGVCQRLGNIAANKRWGTETRQSAIRFLEEIYRGDAVWGGLLPIKAYILDILKHLQKLSPNVLPDVPAVFEALSTVGDVYTQDLYRAIANTEPSQQLLESGETNFERSLMDRVQKKMDVEADLRRISRIRVKEREGVVYVPPSAKATLQSPDNALFDLIDEVDTFLESDKKVLLLLGDSGAGKTTFNRELELKLWKDRPRTGRIPLLVSLPTIDRPDKELIAKHLRQCEFTDPQIRELKERQFVIICDGYDESQQSQNLYESNGLNKDGGWNAQMIVSCRTEHLGEQYQYRFQPHRTNPTDPDLFQEAVLVPFSPKQVSTYIEKYVTIKKPLWEVVDYLFVLEQIPSLKELVKNPFLLTLTLEVLPRLADPGQVLTSNKVTRVQLYDEFVAQWLERSKRRMIGNAGELTDLEKRALDNLCEDDFIRKGLLYLRDLSMAIYQENRRNPVVTYLNDRDTDTWKEPYFGRKDEEIRLLRLAIPMTRNGARFGFIHRSILEYGVSRAIYAPSKRTGLELEVVETDEKQQRKSFSSVFSFELPEMVPEKAVPTVQGPDPDSLLMKRSFVKDVSVLQFLAERVQPEPAFRNQLLAYIEASKKDKKWRTAAANAITILVRAGYPFSQMDLQRIRIPGADLSNGVFDSVQFQGSDMRMVNLRSCWLRQSNLSNTLMDKAQFGEWPMLNDDPMSTVFEYSHNGSFLAVATDKPFGATMKNTLNWDKTFSVSVYSTSTWEKILALGKHADGVMSIAFSPDDSKLAYCTGGSVWLYETQRGEHLRTWDDHSDDANELTFSPDGTQLATCGQDSAVRIYDVQTKRSLHVLTHATPDSDSGDDDSDDGDLFGGRGVCDLSYSPNGYLLASCADKTIQIWDPRSGERIHVLKAHLEAVKMAAFSPSGERIVSASEDGTAKIWDVSTGECLHTLEGNMIDVLWVAYSTNGRHIATASADCTGRLWDAESGTPGPILRHTGRVSAIAFSPNSLQVATTCGDGTVQQWDTQSGSSIAILQAPMPMATLSYAPNGLQLASVGRDTILRLWDAQSMAGFGSGRAGHQLTVKFLSFLPVGLWVASASFDNTVRLWDRTTGEPGHVISGHTSLIRGLAHSPCGGEIATCSQDSTVRLYDVESGKCNFTLEGHNETVVDVVYSPCGRLIASAGYDKTVRVWSRYSGSVELVLTGHTEALRSLVFSPSGEQIASASDDTTIRLWDVTTPQCQFVLEGHTKKVTSVIYSPEGNLLASTSEDSSCRLWDPITGTLLCNLEGTMFGTSSLVFSPNGEQIATSACVNLVRFWDTATGKRTITLKGHTMAVNAVVFSRDGRRAISAGNEDRSVIVWDAKTGERLATVEDMGGRVTCLAVDPAAEDTIFMTGCGDATVSVWRLLERENSPCKVVLIWTSTSGRLVATDMNIQDAVGLGRVNAKLLTQRGAIGEPVPPVSIRQLTTKMLGVSSAALKFKKKTLPSDLSLAPVASETTTTIINESLKEVVSSTVEEVDVPVGGHSASVSNMSASSTATLLPSSPLSVSMSKNVLNAFTAGKNMNTVHTVSESGADESPAIAI
ncbi:hypothetical protein BGZ83_003704 [Gryganskiella cystojenkinii]|nr:hypothetical protein BGZ83_003704 [Gryganskiella cystojenkinii]